MKKYILLALAIVLTATLFTGCGCTSQDAQYTTMPTTQPTIATTAPTTQATTFPTTEATTQSTIDRGNGPLNDTTGNTPDTTEQTQEGRTRQMQPSTNSR